MVRTTDRAYRITSYNVCYTKLLRDEQEIHKYEAGSVLKIPFQTKMNVGNKDADVLVITSYSIHYTKLYEKQFR